MRKDKGLFNVNLIYFIILVLLCVVRIIWASGIVKSLSDYSSYVFTLVVQVGIMFLLPLFLYSLLSKKKTKETFKDFSFKKINGKSIALSFAIGIIVFILNMFVASFFNFILSMFGYYPTAEVRTIEATWYFFLLEVVAVAVFPAFGEEFSHRGLLLKGFYSLGLKRAVIFSALLFGLVHLNVGQFFYAAVIGGVLAIVTVLTGSIFPAIIIHFMNNFINKYLSFAAALDWPLGNFYSFVDSFLDSFHPIVAMLILAVIIMLLVFLLIFMIVKLFKINALGSIKEFTTKMSLINLRKEVLHDVEGIEETIQEQEKNIPAGSRKPYDVPVELLGIPVKPLIKPSLTDNIFFYASLFLGGLITIFTFIWGVI